MRTKWPFDDKFLIFCSHLQTAHTTKIALGGFSTRFASGATWNSKSKLFQQHETGFCDHVLAAETPKFLISQNDLRVSHRKCARELRTRNARWPLGPRVCVYFSRSFNVAETVYRAFKIWWRQRQRQRHKSMIWLVEWRKTIVLQVQHAFWCNVLTKSAKRRREIFIFAVLTTTRARSRKSFTLYMKTIRTKQAKVHFAYSVQRDQHGIIAKDLN